MFLALEARLTSSAQIRLRRVRGLNTTQCEPGWAGRRTSRKNSPGARPFTQYYLHQWWPNLGSDGTARLIVDYYQNDGTFISTAVLGTLSGATGGYQQIRATITTPSNCSAMMLIGVVINSTDYWLLDDVMCRLQVTSDDSALIPDGKGGLVFNTGNLANLLYNGDFDAGTFTPWVPQIGTEGMDRLRVSDTRVCTIFSVRRPQARV